MRGAAAAALLAGALLAGLPRAAAQDPPELETATRLCASADYRDRLQGLGLLEAFPGDGRAVKVALKACSDPDWAVVIRAVQALGKIGNDESRDPLLRLAVEGEIHWIRAAAAAALAGRDAAASANRLLGAARAVKDPVLQARALEAVGTLAGQEAVAALSAFPVNREPQVGAAAVRAVGRVAARDPKAEREALDLFLRVLPLRAERRSFAAYAAAVEGLGGLPSREAAAILLEEMSKAPDDDPYIPERIARGLALPGRTKVGEAVDSCLGSETNPVALRRYARLAGRNRLVEALPGLRKCLSHADERVRSEATRAMGLLAVTGVAEELRALLKDRSPYVRLEAVSALARLPGAALAALGPEVAADREELVRLQWIVEVDDRRDLASLDALEKFFEDKSWRVGSAALAAAGTLGAAPDLPRFLPASSHKDWRVRAAAFEAMGRLRAKEAVPLLAAGLKDRDPVVKGVCHANLQILTKQTLPADDRAWAAWWEKSGATLDIVKRSRRDAATITRELAEADRYGKDFYGKRGVEVLQKARILVVTGAWDHVEKVLDHLKIPCTVMRAQQLKEAGLNPNQVVLVNCEGNVDPDSAERLQWFVNVGGYAMTTDWALTKAVRTCFPGYADQFPGANTGNDVVVVEEATQGHRYVEGVFDAVPAMKWWLEIQAFPIRVLYPERVEVLVDSREMKQKYGSSTLGLVFRWGLGRVQHSVSHFFLQEEGMTQARGEKARMVFSADHLGLSLDEIRDIASKGGFTGSITEEAMKRIAPSYSMFRLIVNFVGEKSRWVEDL